MRERRELGDERELDREARRSMRDCLCARLDDEGGASEADVLRRCGEEVGLVCTCCGAEKMAIQHCDRRYCPMCAPALSAERVSKTRRAVEAMRWPLAVTLTIKNVPRLSRSVFGGLLKSFRKLRQRVLWRSCVVGGFVACEVTNRGKGWHPHLHILADCEWLAIHARPPRRADSAEARAAAFRASASELERDWSAIVGQDQSSVRVRRKAGRDGAVSAQMEAMKYSVKPDALLAGEGSALEVIQAIKGVRLFSGFGSCYGLKLDEKKPPARPCAICGEVAPVLPARLVESLLSRSREDRPMREASGRRAAFARMEAEIAHRNAVAKADADLARLAAALSENQHQHQHQHRT